MYTICRRCNRLVVIRTVLTRREDVTTTDFVHRRVSNMRAGTLLCAAVSLRRPSVRPSVRPRARRTGDKWQVVAPRVFTYLLHISIMTFEVILCGRVEKIKVKRIAEKRANDDRGPTAAGINNAKPCLRRTEAVRGRARPSVVYCAGRKLSAAGTSHVFVVVCRTPLTRSKRARRGFEKFGLILI